MTDALRAEIEAERARQDAQWGGPAHDDGHDALDWCDFIGTQIDYAREYANDHYYDTVEPPIDEIRDRLIKIAALAVAAIESLDRKGKK